MKKIFLIAYRDFIIRIRNKTFLISTLLLPIGIAFFYGMLFFFASNDSDTHRIGIVDKNNYLSNRLKDEGSFQFIAFKSDEMSRTKEFGDKTNLDAIIIIPESKDKFMSGEMEVWTFTKLGIMTKSKFEKILQKIIVSDRFADMNIEPTKLTEIQKDIKLNYQSVSGSEENDMRETIAYALSFGLGIMMYIILTIYGAQVMRGVMEEKTNRIVEIIISSVKPFELLMGKIIGIGMVSFLQLTVWAFFLIILNFGVGLFLGISHISSETTSVMSNLPMASATNQFAQNPELINAIQNIQSFNFLPIFLIFAFYFIGGFFLYSSLFASVGSAVGDDPQDVQSLMMPIMLPIFLSFIFLSKAINNPNATDVVVASIVPFTAPVVMMSRVVFGILEGVPLWQLILSMVVMILSTIFFIFLAARIYKVGILLYGKKVSWKEMIQWVFIK